LNWAGNRRSSFLKTRISTARSKGWWMESGSTKGQVCCAGSRLLMQESIAEPLIAKIRDRMSTLRIGSPLDKAIDIGAIVDRIQLERIQKLVDQGVAEGATCWQPEVALPARGLYFPPTLLSNVHPTFDRSPAGDFRSGAGGDDIPHAERSG
jgi:acyl-CoA reductase-like NAD-dependent aldehyde dehydrogenase